MKSNLDLVNDCDNFPYYDNDPEAYEKLVSSYYKFFVLGSRRAVGYVLPWVVEKMPWGNQWIIDHDKKRLLPYVEGLQLEKSGEQSQVIDETLLRAKEIGAFEVIKKWRNELYTIHGADQLISMERSGSPLFGIVTYGVHMTTYVRTKDGMKIWVPKRAKGKTYGGLLDNTVAGGIATGEIPSDCIVREAAEEASFPEDLVRSCMKPCGTISYFSFRDERAGGEVGLLQPEVQYVYDMEVGEDVVPKPCDDEVEIFQLWTVAEVQEALSKRMFKPNCALYLLDFFIRHGILTPENEKNYVEIVSRLHRKLPFPTVIAA
ncbi:MAG: hypothetical protein L6R41_002365 [Letrouitia leprolyta]|nr:MAG: hypothetical protein L6R41_002365 [Letrouitia leprolyta]